MSSVLSFRTAAAVAGAFVLLQIAPAAADRESAHDVEFNRACALPDGGKVEFASAHHPAGDRTKRLVWTRMTPRGAKTARRFSVLRIGGRIRLAKLTTLSKSGKWYLVQRFCYGADGRITHAQTVLQTRHGNVRVIDLVAFRSGKPPKRLSRTVYDLKTGKRLKPGTRKFRGPKLVILETSAAASKVARPVIR